VLVPVANGSDGPSGNIRKRDDNQIAVV
jgi:hypothetical protein